MNRLHRENPAMLAAARLLPTAMMHERGIHGETVCPDLALSANWSASPEHVCR